MGQKDIYQFDYLEDYEKPFIHSEKIIQGKKCYIYKNGKSDVLLIQAIDGHDLEVLDQEAEIIKQAVPGTPFTLAAFLVEDWNNELSPWNAPAVFGQADFGSGAAETLAFITGTLIPELCAADGKKHILLGGYSLSGLFALWAAYQTDLLNGIAAVSPSVWFPGWTDYIESNTIRSPQVYLSLGSKEEKTRNKTMAAVGENIRRQYELLTGTNAVERCILEWNPGNHFADSEKRMAKGFAWLMNR